MTGWPGSGCTTLSAHGQTRNRSRPGQKIFGQSGLIGIGIELLKQIIQIVFRNGLKLGQDPFNHAHSKTGPVMKSAIDLQLMIHRNRCPERRQKFAVQPRPVKNRLQTQRSGIVNHQPDSLPGDARQFGEGMFDEPHMSDAQRPHDEGLCQPPVQTEFRDKTGQICGLAGLLHKVERCALARAGSQVYGQLSRKFMPVDQHVKGLAGHHEDKLFGDVRRNVLAQDQ